MLCSRCQKVDAGDFIRCEDCRIKARRRYRRYYDAHPDKIRARSARQRRTPRYRYETHPASVKKYRAKAWLAWMKDWQDKFFRRWAASHPGQIAQRDAVHHATLTGLVTRSITCQNPKCGRRGCKIVAVLIPGQSVDKILWLCWRCHYQHIHTDVYKKQMAAATGVPPKPDKCPGCGEKTRLLAFRVVGLPQLYLCYKCHYKANHAGDAKKPSRASKAG